MRPLLVRRLPSDAHRSFEDLLERFLAEAENLSIAAACFGIAGPVTGDLVQATNLPWSIHRGKLQRRLKTPRVALVNDMEATFHGLDHLDPEALATLQAGQPVPGATQALIAAGTGLGEALRIFFDGRFRVIPTEGGHADFAPRSEQEFALLQFVRRRRNLHWVSVEQIVSGRGFRLIHEFLDASVTHAAFEDPARDAAAEITGHALTKSCPVCVATVDLWLTLYGAEAGNLALRTLALGGLYVAGGIAPKIWPLLQQGRFLQAFQEKGELIELLQRVPVHVVRDEEVPLKGAAAVAVGLLSAQ
jgi:glucokinase